MSGCSGPISSVWSGASLYPQLNPEDNCWTFAALTEVPRRGVQRLGTRWGESDSDGISDDQVLITSRMRAILLQRGMVLEQELRFHRASRDAQRLWTRQLALLLVVLGCSVWCLGRLDAYASSEVRYPMNLCEPVHATLCDCTQPDGMQTRGYVKMIKAEPAAVAGGEAERSLTAAVTMCAEHVQQPQSAITSQNVTYRT
jgi:hypothetical protein